MTPSQLLEIARDLAIRGGDLVRDDHGRHRAVAETKSSEVDPVTEMDRRVETFLRSELARLRPRDAILGEEGDDVPGTSGLTWVLDPIDGTVNFVYGVASCAVSVAVVKGTPDPREWQALAGCVHSVDDGRTWWAARGVGAWRGVVRDGELVDVRKLEPIAEPAPLARSLVGTGFGYDSARRADQARVLVQVLPKVRDIRRLGSAAIDLCLVAEGALDLYFERGLNPWDQAAGALIATEAGAHVSGLYGQGPSVEMVVAGAGEAREELVRLLENAGATDHA